MMFASLLLAVAVATVNVAAAPNGNQPGYSPWSLKKFTSLVLFGDSYTDEGRLNYMIANNLTFPPVGWEEPVSNATASGGKVWPRFVARQTGVNLYNYAVSGAVCSNDITPRAFYTTLFPAVQQYEVPAFIADSKYIEPNGTKFMHNPPDETVYAIWIGTNDLGAYAFLTDSQVPGKTVADYVDCVYDSLDRVYRNGGRNFVIMNLAPLQLSPLYGLPADGGVRADHYWPDKPKNITQVSYRMKETVVALNDVYKYRTPYEVQVANRYPGADFAVFDMYSLLTDIYDNPDQYLANPANATGYQDHCDVDGGNCYKLPHPNSFLWYDELHPSEKTDRVIAREFVNVVEGNSQWASYYSARR